MTYKERLIELLQHSPADAMGNHGVGAMADHLMDNGLVFKEMYDDIEERLAQQRVRAQTAEFFICKLCENCDYEDNNGIITTTMKCCSMFPECGKFKLRSGWIPVSERLPEKDGKFLVHRLIFGGVSTMSVVGFARNGKKVHEYDLRKKKNVWYEYDSEVGYYALDTVTHWMPLPEPPMEDL